MKLMIEQVAPSKELVNLLLLANPTIAAMITPALSVTAII